MHKNGSVVNQYFDQIYVINLEHRSDRKMAMLQKLSQLNIAATFVQAINGHSPQNKKEFQAYFEQPIGTNDCHHLETILQKKLISSPGAWGYLKTYLGVLHDAKKNKYNRILVFDDDVLFHRDFDNKFKQVIPLLPDDWKLIYLGASQYLWNVPDGLCYPNAVEKGEQSNDGFYFPNKTDGSFAMGIDGSLFDILMREIVAMNCPFDTGPLRTVNATFPKKCFVLKPNIVIADVTESDIRAGQNQQELAEKLRWNMEDYQKWNQEESTLEKSILSTSPILVKSLKYNTLKLDRLVIVPELEYETLKWRAAEMDRAIYKIMKRNDVDIQQSLSWKITAPLRWLADLLLRITKQ